MLSGGPANFVVEGRSSTMDSGAVTVAVAQAGSQVELVMDSDCGAAEYDGDGDAVGGVGGRVCRIRLRS